MEGITSCNNSICHTCPTYKSNIMLPFRPLLPHHTRTRCQPLLIATLHHTSSEPLPFLPPPP